MLKMQVKEEHDTGEDVAALKNNEWSLLEPLDVVKQQAEGHVRTTHSILL